MSFPPLIQQSLNEPNENVLQSNALSLQAASSVQNEFETSVSYKNDEDTENGTDGSDDSNWICEEEPLKGTDGSRIAAYHPGKSMWRCYECCDVMGGGPREVAEHFMELHSARILTDDSRNRHHSPRKDYLQTEFKIDDIVLYLDRLRQRAERAAPPSRRTQETQTVSSALLPMTSNSLLLQELPSASTPQHLQNATTLATSATTVPVSSKRYTCPYCPYGTDRRDLYTRHENIHREEKPFYCYVCGKPFNRADHVKKHFMRMHRDQPYEISKIRRPVGTAILKPLQPEPSAIPVATDNANSQQQAPQQHTTYQPSFPGNKSYQLQPNAASSTNTGTIYHATTMPAPVITTPPDATNCNTVRRVQNGGCNSKSHLKGGSKSAQERRYCCCYCSWTGVDNWCLKRHMNTHLKPFGCTLCEYKAARSERLATHVLKVHNRRQCSRCSFLGEDLAQLQMHQLHVHRVSSASAPATSTAQAAPPPSNRHQQPLHPAGGGRPPPGPPVFPAPAPAIAPATTVIPPTTILGHEMVKSPATATTMAYPMEEEKRSYSRIGGINGATDDGNVDDDNDGVVRGNGNREERSRDLGMCRVCGLKSDRHDNLEPCSDHGDGSSKNDATDMFNGDFTCSQQLFARLETNIIGEPSSIRNCARPHAVENTSPKKQQRTRRARKQSQPRRSRFNLENNDPTLDQDTSEEELPSAKRRTNDKQVNQIATRRTARPRLFKCHLCPRHAPARRSSHRPYHTRTSLMLHKLWRHKPRSSNSRVCRANLSSPVSSIILKATFFASPCYRTDYHR